MLDNRLLACATLVSGKGIAVDIGTDHGYLPCYLVQNGICEKAVAADVNTAPLMSAVKNIEKCGLADKVDAVLSDGLTGLSAQGVSDVIIAGMGGELIADIISRGKSFYDAQFILQPMTKPEYLRKWLWDNGFEIALEKACKDEFYYTVMLVQFTGKNTSYNEEMLYVGKMKNETDEEKGWLLKQAEKLSKKGEGLLRSQDNSDCASYYLSLSQYIKNYAKGEL